jgi:hypothetical protein
MAQPLSPKPRSIWPRWDENRLFTVLLGILVVYASVWLLSEIKNNAKEFTVIGKAPEEPRTVVIEGTGKVSVAPTIARVSAGVLTEGGTDIATSQRENTDRMNALIAAFTGLGIPREDLQTESYTIYPRYDYTDGKSVLVGYNVNQSVKVKVRDLTKVSAVFQKAGELGANQVSGPDFTIDDPEAIRAEARAKAIRNAAEKGLSLAETLGVRLVRVASYQETVAAPPGLYEFAKLDGLGGGGPPQIEAGSLDVVSNVTITYEIQ